MSPDRDAPGSSRPAVSTGSPRLHYLVVLAIASAVTSGALRLGVAPRVVLLCAAAVAVLPLTARFGIAVHAARRTRHAGAGRRRARHGPRSP
ncbi:hypothetical protein [Actinomadura chibensis]|uniref:Uncharacterized protein n=1 Tax=Actinomadura chibensis TaxID=392828 RepID=A0A5D0N6S0_9ACTN|nr:hypothetical protein [Actinomadura chibensis]TYB40152.1 hypothetical protein FXF69_39895 [Actinomadura chibensis]